MGKRNLRSRLGSLSRFFRLSPGPMGADGLHIVQRKKHHMKIAASPRARTGRAIAMMSAPAGWSAHQREKEALDGERRVRCLVSADGRREPNAQRARGLELVAGKTIV
jgi:hypothetical protein